MCSTRQDLGIGGEDNFVFYNMTNLYAFLSMAEDHKAKCDMQYQLKGQCPDYAHARTSSVFSSTDNRTVILTRQDFLPDRTADGYLLFTFSSIRLI